MGTHEKQLSPTVLLIQESNEFKLANAPVTSVEFKSTRREFNQNYVYYELFTGLFFFSIYILHVALIWKEFKNVTTGIG